MFDDVLDNTHFRKSSICSFMLTAASINWCVTHEYTNLVIGQINPTILEYAEEWLHIGIRTFEKQGLLGQKKNRG